MPENTVKIDRSTRYGNPSYVVLDEMRSTGDDGSVAGPWLCGLHVDDRPRLAGFWFGTKREASEKAVELFRWRMTESPLPHDVARRELIEELRGKNVGCWCGIDDPCHGDVWIELANAPSLSRAPKEG